MAQRTFMKLKSVAALLAVSAASAMAETYILADGTTVGVLETFRDCDVCPEMVALPLGSFMTGSEPGDMVHFFMRTEDSLVPVAPEERATAVHATETPRHEVVIDLPIAIGRTEVTFGEWRACIEDGGCAKMPDMEVIRAGPLDDVPVTEVRVELTDDHPVAEIDLVEIQAYLDWLNGRVGAEVYRLPTEAEWEYAARAGTTTRFAQGDMVTPGQVNYSGRYTANTPSELRPDLVSRPTSVPVEEMDAANPWGLRHMSGNVAEVTSSCWTVLHRGWDTSSEHRARARITKDDPNVCEDRVIRGGSYRFHLHKTRPGARTVIRGNLGRNRGFRVVRDVGANPLN